MLQRLAKACGRPVFFPLLQYNEAPTRWHEIAEACAQARREGANMYGQVVGRPVGILYGLELSSHPFSGCPSYRAIAHLPLEQRVTAMRDTTLRARRRLHKRECHQPISGCAPEKLRFQRSSDRGPQPAFECDSGYIQSGKE
jgi:hypothetical protein